MTNQAEVALTFFIYIIFWAWIGYQRGRQREIAVFVVAVISWLLLNERGDIAVRMVNLGSKFFAFIRGGGLGTNPDEAFVAVREAPQWVTPASQPGFLFLLWIIILLATYWYTGKPKTFAKVNHDGWAAIMGIVNGLFLTSVLLPRLISIVNVDPAFSGGGIEGQAPLQGLLSLLLSILSAIFRFLGSFWSFIEPQRPVVILFILLLILGATAYTLRSPSAPAKK